MSKFTTTQEPAMSYTAAATEAATEELRRVFYRPAEITDELVNETARRALNHFLAGVTMTEGASLAVRDIFEGFNNLYRARDCNF